MKIYGLMLKSGNIQAKMYRYLGHAKNACHLRKGSSIIEFDAVESGVIFRPTTVKRIGYVSLEDYVWEIEDKNLFGLPAEVSDVN